MWPQVWKSVAVCLCGYSYLFLVVTSSERAFYVLLVVFLQSSFYERFRAGPVCALALAELLEDVLASFDRFY